MDGVTLLLLGVRGVGSGDRHPGRQSGLASRGRPELSAFVSPPLGRISPKEGEWRMWMGWGQRPVGAGVW